jgi:hypothetical protein
VWDNVHPLYSPSDFVDEHGKPIADDLPSPRVIGAPGAAPPSPNPSVGAGYADDEPL